MYFDTNVFSKLKANDLYEYQQLNLLLEKCKFNHSFFFSPAHINDKMSDTSDKKLADFIFMESFVSDNHISYHGIEKTTTHYLATPLMVYNDTDGDPFDLSSIFKVLDPNESDDDQILTLKSMLKEIRSNFYIPLDTIDVSELSDEHRAIVSKIIPLDKPFVTFEDILNRSVEFYGDMFTSTDSYRDLRRLIDEGVNCGKFTIKDDVIDFDQAFKDSVFKKTFNQYIVHSMNAKEGDKIKLYDFLIQAYSTLDYLGISKDKLSKKNGYKNLFNDGLHCYYASYSDYFVTEDSGLLKKARALYNFLGIETKVLNAIEFLELLPSIGPQSEVDILHFFEKLSIAIRESERRGVYTSDDNLVQQFDLPISNLYLNFFDELTELLIEDKVYYILSKRNVNHLSKPNFREICSITNRCVLLFGVDVSQDGEFHLENERELINNDDWQGRIWIIGTLRIWLHYSDTFGYCLTIDFLN